MKLRVRLRGAASSEGSLAGVATRDGPGKSKHALDCEILRVKFRGVCKEESLANEAAGACLCAFCFFHVLLDLPA